MTKADIILRRWESEIIQSTPIPADDPVERQEYSHSVSLLTNRLMEEIRDLPNWEEVVVWADKYKPARSIFKRAMEAGADVAAYFLLDSYIGSLDYREGRLGKITKKVAIKVLISWEIEAVSGCPDFNLNLWKLVTAVTTEIRTLDGWKDMVLFMEDNRELPGSWGFWIASTVLEVGVEQTVVRFIDEYRRRYGSRRHP